MSVLGKEKMKDIRLNMFKIIDYISSSSSGSNLKREGWEISDDNII